MLSGFYVTDQRWDPLSLKSQQVGPCLPTHLLASMLGELALVSTSPNASMEC